LKAPIEDDDDAANDAGGVFDDDGDDGDDLPRLLFPTRRSCHVINYSGNASRPHCSLFDIVYSFLFNSPTVLVDC